MPFITTSGGLNFQYPTDGTTNYGQIMAATFAAISSHDHSGSGKGTPISAAGLVANTVNDTAIRLRNGQYLRALNAAGSADINIVGVDSSDRVVFGATGLYSTNVRSFGAAMVIGTTDANDIQFNTNGSNKFSYSHAAASLRPALALGATLGTAALPWASVSAASLNSSGNELTLDTVGANGITLKVNAFTCWRLNPSTGGLDGDATNGGNVTFNRAGRSVVDKVSGTLTATGSTQGGALALTNTINNVTVSTLGSADGVMIDPTSAMAIGQCVEIVANCVDPVKAYPPSGGSILGLSVNAAKSVPIGTSMVFRKLTSTAYSFR